MAEIEFWFDFNSPYGYFGALQIEEIAARHGRGVVWRAFLLGAILPVTGMQNLVATPLRGDYARRDWARLARRMGVPFQLPAADLSMSVTAGRSFYFLEKERPDAAKRFARRYFEESFGRGTVFDEATVVALAAEYGADAAMIAEALHSEEMRARFRAVTEEGKRRGVFGSPFFFVDGEPFWGADRLPMVDEWLATGGW